MKDSLKKKITPGFCWCFPGVEPASGLRRLRELGFEGVELWPDHIAPWGIARWAEALTETCMLCLQLCPYFNFMGGESSIEASRAILEEYLGMARLTGCRRIRAFTGPPWGKGVVGARDATEQQWNDSIRTLREFCDRAAGEGVEICLECHEGSLMEDTPATLRLLQGVDRPNLTTNLQLPLVNEPWQTSVAALARTTSHVHIHNWTPEGELTFLDAGTFDWEPPVRAFLEEGPGRLTLSVEHATVPARDPWETARRDGIYLNRLCEKLSLPS